eukprot:TRINITY_DN18045_c0_g1_i1.p1 TRINITY_DN18045_c0_g1~~TRINITY_DN18045_c0_g1_i1.p1  ORF type:complete len:134 (+),score=56.44 TRINITY_DN18045_c0_g1_i1:91-492(+)
MCIRDRYQRRVHGEYKNQKYEWSKEIEETQKEISILQEDEEKLKEKLNKATYKEVIEKIKEMEKFKEILGDGEEKREEAVKLEQQLSILLEEQKVMKRKWNYLEICDQESLSCLLYTSPSPRDLSTSRMPSSA